MNAEGVWLESTGVTSRKIREDESASVGITIDRLWLERRAKESLCEMPFSERAV